MRLSIDSEHFIRRVRRSCVIPAASSFLGADVARSVFQSTGGIARHAAHTGWDGIAVSISCLAVGVVGCLRPGFWLRLGSMEDGKSGVRYSRLGISRPSPFLCLQRWRNESRQTVVFLDSPRCQVSPTDSPQHSSSAVVPEACSTLSRTCRPPPLPPGPVCRRQRSVYRCGDPGG